MKNRFLYAFFIASLMTNSVFTYLLFQKETVNDNTLYESQIFLYQRLLKINHVISDFTLKEILIYEAYNLGEKDFQLYKSSYFEFYRILEDYRNRIDDLSVFKPILKNKQYQLLKDNELRQWFKVISDFINFIELNDLSFFVSNSHKEFFYNLIDDFGECKNKECQTLLLLMLTNELITFETSFHTWNLQNLHTPTIEPYKIINSW